VPVPRVQVPTAELASIRVTMEDGEKTDEMVPAILYHPIHGSTKTVELPPELALREIPALDITDAEALLAFTAKYGPLTPTGDDLGTKRGEHDLTHLLPDDTAHRFIQDRSTGIPDGRKRQPQPFVPVPLISQHVRILRAVIAHWLAYQHEEDVGVIRKAWTDNGFANVARADIDLLWGVWSDHLNAALTPFSTRISVEGPHGEVGLQHPTTTAYSAMMLQIWNNVADRTPWKVCENETCGRLFGRQQGRAEAGQNRTVGVRYCTNSCAHAQTQRNYRRKKGAQK
jgi:hypothetical protein